MSSQQLPSSLVSGTPLRWYALIGAVTAASYDGIPRGAPAGAVPSILILDSFEAGTAFVDAYDAELGYIGDWPFSDREQAALACIELFGLHEIGWHPIPEDVENAEVFVLKRAARGGQRG